VRESAEADFVHFGAAISIAGLRLVPPISAMLPAGRFDDIIAANTEAFKMTSPVGVL
jgi:hypothetical protein